MEKLPTKEEFEHEIESTFNLESGDVSIELVLAKVDDHGSGGGVTSFSLVFHGPAGIEMEQGSYKLKHQRFGDIELFLSPFNEDETKIYLESVFSLIEES